MFSSRFGALACLVLLPLPVTADERPRTDLYGDPLPEGAIARLGSVRLRHAGLWYFLPQEGNTVLTTGNDSVLRIWDLATGRQTRAVVLQGTSKPDRGVALSRDGKWLVAFVQRDLVVWEAASGKEIKTLPGVGPQSALISLQLSPDGKTVAVGAWDKTISQIQWETGQQRAVPLPVRKIGMDSTFHDCFSPDGKWFVAGGGSNEPLCVFEQATLREVYRLPCNASRSTVSPDSKRLAVASMRNDRGDGETVIRLFDLATGKEAAQFPLGHNDSFYTLSFASDGKTLACGYSDRSCLFDTEAGRVLHRLPRRQGGVAFSLDSKTLLTTSGSRLQVWDVASGRERHVWPGDFASTSAAAISPDGKSLAAADWLDQAVRVWDLTSGRLLRELPLPENSRYVRNLAYSPDGAVLSAAQYQGAIQFWDAATGNAQRTVQLTDPNRPKQEPAYFFQLHLASNSRRVTTLERVYNPGQTTRLAMWDAATGKLGAQHFFAAELREWVCSADGMTVALPTSDGLSVLEVETGRERFRVAGTKPGGPVALSLDGRLLAGQRGNTVAVWEMATGKEVAAAAGPATSLELGPDNRSLVLVGDGFLRLWDLALGKERQRRPLPGSDTASPFAKQVSRLLVTPDGRQAFTALADGSGIVWDLTAAPRQAPLAERPGEKEYAAWWADLASDDAGRAYAALWRLAEAPEGDVLAFFRPRLKPAAEATSPAIKQALSDLDSDSFAVREKANSRLAELGAAAVPAMRQALEKDPSPEARRRLEALLARSPGLVTSSDSLRRLRAVQVLERFTSPEAGRMLAELAQGTASAVETQDARAAQERRNRRLAKP